MQADDLPSTTIDTPFDAALSERYLVYALSTITARSLPDVRDGLKPTTSPPPRSIPHSTPR